MKNNEHLWVLLRKRGLGHLASILYKILIVLLSRIQANCSDLEKNL